MDNEYDYNFAFSGKIISAAIFLLPYRSGKMMKFLKISGVILFLVLCLTVSLVIYGQKSIPDEIAVTDKSQIGSGHIFTFSRLSGAQKSEQEGETYSVSVSLLNIIPVKTSKVHVSKRHYVIPGGDIFGLKMYSDGVMIVGTGTVETKDGQINPAGNAGIQKGDIILEINDVKVKSSEDVSSLFQNCEGRETKLKLLRGGSELTVSFSPALSASDGKYKAGLWIRDSAAGIGTVTYIDPSTGIYGSLGHAICDTDTGEIIPIVDGEAVSAVVTGCYKGTKGKAGELCGVFSPKHFGSVLINSESGAYGEADNISFPYELVPVASKSEVETGKAQIISTVSSGEKEYYDIEITKINTNDENGKNMCVLVTDSDLIDKTGGIVQGMSGSPIIQNGMLVGAVTHVFVNDARKGYAIFAENMLEISDEIYKNIESHDAA